MWRSPHPKKRQSWQLEGCTEGTLGHKHPWHGDANHKRGHLYLGTGDHAQTWEDHLGHPKAWRVNGVPSIHTLPRWGLAMASNDNIQAKVSRPRPKKPRPVSWEPSLSRWTGPAPIEKYDPLGQSHNETLSVHCSPSREKIRVHQVKGDPRHAT